jgi:hypothetical protein
MLFNHSSIGKTKVEAAAEGLKSHLVGNTEVQTLHMDALDNWPKIVAIAKTEATVVFNNIDVGAVFDYAVLSLCKSLKLPYASGSSYARTCIIEFATGDPKMGSFSLDKESKHIDLYPKIEIDTIQEQENLNFIVPEHFESRQVGSNCLVCVMSGMLTVNAWVQNLMGKDMVNFIKLDIAAFWEPNELVAVPAFSLE